MLVTLYKIGELYYRLLGTNSFLAKAKNERFCAKNERFQTFSLKSVPHVLPLARVVVRTSKMKISRHVDRWSALSADYVKQFSLKSVPHVQHDYFSSFNQSNH